MRNILFVLLLTIISTTAFAQPTAAPEGVALKARIDRVVIPYMRANDIPGAAIAVYKNGHEYFFNYGNTARNSYQPVTANTLFEIASNTKLFTATLLAYEVGQNKIQLNDPMVNYLPALANTRGLPVDRITPEELATHTSSLPREAFNLGARIGSMQDLKIVLSRWQPEYPIGTQYLYSNLGFQLLGRVIQNETATPYNVLVRNTILQPLNMQNTYIFIPKNKLPLLAQGYSKFNDAASRIEITPMLGSGEMVSSTHDLMSFLKANLMVKDNSISPQLASAIQLTHRAYFKVTNKHFLGLAWEMFQSPNGLYYTKNGISPGFNSYISFSLPHEVGIIALFNRNVPNPSPMGGKILTAAIE